MVVAEPAAVATAEGAVFAGVAEEASVVVVEPVAEGSAEGAALVVVVEPALAGVAERVVCLCLGQTLDLSHCSDCPCYLISMLFNLMLIHYIAIVRTSSPKISID